MQGGKGKKQMWIRSFFLIFYGLCAGGLIAASFLAFLSMLGVIPRLAGLTKSMKNARMYESFVALGGILGTLVFLYRWQIKAGYPLLVLYGFVWRNLCGMYDRSFGRNDQKSSDLFKKIKFEIRDSICNLWDRIWKNARMLALFLYIFIK